MLRVQFQMKMKKKVRSMYINQNTHSCNFFTGFTFLNICPIHKILVFYFRCPPPWPLFCTVPCRHQLLGMSQVYRCNSLGNFIVGRELR